MTEQFKKSNQQRKRIGECLVEAGLIDEKTLEKALELQKIEKKKIGRILIEMGAADDEEIAKALARQLRIPIVRLKDANIEKDVISLVPSELAENYLLIPVKRSAKGIIVAMSNPLDLYALDDLRFAIGMPVSVAVAPEGEILNAVERYYPKAGLAKDLASGPELDSDIEIVQRKDPEEKDVEDLLDLSERPPVVRFVNSILADAIKLKVSDIHIEPQKAAVVIRYRIDGIMREIMQTDKHVHASLVSRIKIISNMDISIRRKPQDGKTQARWGEKVYDLRVSTIPTSFGEKVTIRILNPDMAGLNLEAMGFNDRVLENLLNAISMPQGVILVTGPTGSGKSSTLYACLNRINSPQVNIITVEDPIEYDIHGVNQVQINPAAGITFAAGLKSILRQDPDIVMVGEIRDRETAEIAFQAAQTGHLVLSTLHTNDAPSSVTRLLDLGVEPFLVSDSLAAALGQRLVRGICKGCKVPDSLSPQLLKRFQSLIKNKLPETFWKGAGCDACQFTGYMGRLGVFEVLTPSFEFKELIGSGVAAEALKRVAVKEGFQPMVMDGINKAIQGLTTVEEVFRVVPSSLVESPVADVLRTVSAEKEESKEDEVNMTVPSISAIRPPKILLVDDSEIIQKVVCNLLEAEGHILITADNGLDGFKRAVQEKPDLVITDYIMPGMDGLSLIKKLKSQLSTRYIPVVMLTSKGEDDFEVKGIEAGADDYIKKPVNPKVLISRVNRLIRNNRQ